MNGKASCKVRIFIQNLDARVRGLIYIVAPPMCTYRKVNRMNRRTRRNFPRENRNGRGKYDRMLDMGRMNSFTYYADQINRELGGDNNAWNSILASMIAKASRMGIEEAQAFIVEKVKTGELRKEVEEPLLQLLNRYSKVR